MSAPCAKSTSAPSRPPSSKRRPGPSWPPTTSSTARRRASTPTSCTNSSGLLPLDRAKLRSVAVIGPNARTARIMGGGSAQVNAHYQVSPFDALVAKLGDGTTIGYELGCTIYKLLPLIDPAQLYAGRE